jgi:hypothetical protein
MPKETTTDPATAKRAAAAPETPRAYIGPQPPALISNLPCNCKLLADALSRAQQEYLIATAPHTAAWFAD